MKKIFVFLFANLMVFGAMAQVNDAIVLMEAGTLDKAKTAIDKAVQNPKLNIKAKTWYTYGKVYRAIGSSILPAYKALDTNAYVKAYEGFMKAKEVEPAYKDMKKVDEELKTLSKDIAIVKIQKEDFAGALPFFEKAQEADPKDTTAFLFGAYAAQNTGANMYDKDTTKAREYFRKAIPMYEKAIESGVNSKWAYTSLISLYKSEKKYDQGLAFVKKAAKKYPENKNWQTEEILLMQLAGREDEAIKLMEESIKADPTNVVYNAQLGVYYDKKGDKAKALEFYDKVLKLEPDNFDINYNAGVVYFNKAALLYNQIQEDSKKLKAGQKDPRTPESEELFRSSLKYFEKANAVKPNDIDVLKNLSAAYRQLKMKDKEAAINKMIENMN